MELKVGDLAPDFTLNSTSKQNFTLSKSIAEKKGTIVLFFYPGDFSTICTKEAIHFKDEFDSLLEHGVQVIGINTNNLKSHQKFKEALGLPYDLLSDPAGEVCKLYNAYRPLLSQAGRKTYVIGPDQRIQTICEGGFNAARHVHEAKKGVREIQPEEAFDS